MAIYRHMNSALFVLTGPSGVGKTTVLRTLLSKMPDLQHMVTCTSRPMREGEVDGVDYHFISPEEFERGIGAGEFFEWAKVYDRYYGNRISDLRKLQETGKPVIMAVDVQGAKTIKENEPAAHIVFLAVDSIETLKTRILNRGEMEPEQLKTRLDKAQSELEYGSSADFWIENKEGGLADTTAAIEAYIRQNT